MAARRRAHRWCLFAALALLLVPAAASWAAAPPPPQWASWELAPGVDHLLTERPGLVAHAARVQPGAAVALRVVVAHDRVGGGHAPHDGRQPVTDLCARSGGIACVNGDFFNCGSCGQVTGGLVDRGRPLRSFRGDHEQASIVAGVPTLDPVRWVGTVRGMVGRHGFRLPLASLNRGPMPGGAALYSPDWGPVTPRVPGQVEIVFAAGGPYVPGVMQLVPVARRAESGPIPRDGIVVAGNGRAAQQLDWLWEAWHKGGARRLALDTALSAPADLTVGGHPILLRHGEVQQLDPADPLVVRRHPRTLLGWTAAGELLLVTIDGRQPGYSAGATLYEATELLRGLGATDAVNLDGGGSTTFALRCPTGACVANRPSGGGQRPVPVALALVPADGAGDVLRAAAVTDAPLPAPASPPPPAPTTTTIAPAVTETAMPEPPPASVIDPARAAAMLRTDAVARPAVEPQPASLRGAAPLEHRDTPVLPATVAALAIAVCSSYARKVRSTTPRAHIGAVSPASSAARCASPTARQP